jgi:SAM-dependent methyltransferase
MRRTVTRFLPAQLRHVLRPAARVLGFAAPAGAWDRLGVRIENHPYGPPTEYPCVCNICQWTGEQFSGPFHCEMADCPRCGSIARDRFLILSFLSRALYSSETRVLETSPRLGAAYRRLMRRTFHYTASDFDLSAHEGDIRLDLQDIDLPTQSVDILLTPHVLEHVPNTERALGEIMRILSPGGRMYLQVPLTRGTTAVPTTPEFHNDNTPVFFNFGWDLTSLLRAAGFDVRVLVTEEFFGLLADRDHRPEPTGDGFDLPALWDDVSLDDLTVLVDRTISQRLGFLPAHHFVTWECTKPGP